MTGKRAITAADFSFRTTAMRQLGAAGAALGLTLLSGCSLTLGLDDEQPCENDSECVYSNGQGSCVNNICQAPGGGEGTTTGGPTTDGPTSATTPTGTSMTDPTVATSTTPDTETTIDPPDTDSETDTETDSDTEVTGCSVNTDCSTDQRCGSNDTCVELLSAECQILQYPSGDYDRDTIVYVGSILPTGGAFANLVQPIENSVQLGFEDFNSETTLQGDRKLAWVGCDSTAGVEAAVAAAEHLSDNVAVPAIIGPLFSESVLEVATEVTVDRGVFIISPTATATSISSLDDDNLVWRTISPDSYQANAVIDRMLDLRAGPVETRLERLLILAKGDAYGNGILGAIQTELENGLPGVEIHSASYENPTNFDSQDELLASYGATLAGAFTALPGTFVNREDHYTDVLIIGTAEAQSLLYGYLGQWATYQVPMPDPSPEMPRFTYTHGVVPDMQRLVDDIGVLKGTDALVPLKPLINSRQEGISPNIFDEANFAAFNIRYRIRFNNQDAITTAAVGYDATLATFFAMSGIASDDPITGASIAATFPSLMDSSADLISFSGATLQFISEARNAMAVEGGSVDLQGVSGELTWDDAGDIRTGLLGWILTDNDGDPMVVDPLLTAVRTYLLNEAPATDGNWVDLP